MSFEEVAVHFTSEEWSLLDSRQKALHQEVMLETCRIVASLGKVSSGSGVLNLWAKAHYQSLAYLQLGDVAGT